MSLTICVPLCFRMDDFVSLRSVCLEYCADHPEVYSQQDPITGLYTIRQGVHIPVQICDALLKNRKKEGQLTKAFLHIFSDRSKTALESVDLSYSRTLDDESVKWVTQHNLSELNMLGLNISFDAMKNLTENCTNLRTLHLDSSMIQCWCSLSDSKKAELGDGNYLAESVMCCPKLTCLTVHRLGESGRHLQSAYPMLVKTLQHSPYLTYLDMSYACFSKTFEFPAESLRNLKTLILFGAYIYDGCSYNRNNCYSSLFPSIAKLKTLRYVPLYLYLHFYCFNSIHQIKDVRPNPVATLILCCQPTSAVLN